MPELAEVHWFAGRRRAGVGKTVVAVAIDANARVFRDCDVRSLEKNLRGQKLVRIATAGKQAAFVFSGGAWLGVRLGMTGRLFTETGRAAQPAWAREETGDIAPTTPDRKHDLLSLTLDDGARLVFNDPRRFGKILFHAGPDEPAWWRNRSPEILSPEFDDSRLADILRTHPKRALKPLLLDQSFFPGIGNRMADEVLRRAGIAPKTPAGSLDATRRAGLFIALKTTCADALRVIGDDWGAPPDTWLFNHRWKKGGVCPATGRPLLHETIGGRTTCRSPAKQT